MSKWKLVPIEPDDAMIEEGEDVIDDRQSTGMRVYAADIYESMISASPSTPDVISSLIECLQWYIDNDDTNEGGVWDEKNAFWIAGKNRAIALLEKLKKESQ